MSGHLARGASGEEAAAQWYANQGYELIARNWRIPAGEIDIICAHGDTVVFVEVKTRASARYGSGMVAVDRRKQQRLRRLAGAWLADSERFFNQIRFDVVDVDARGHLKVVENAF